MLRRPHYIALVLVGVLTLVILNLPQHTASQIKLAFGSLFLPLFGLSKSSQQVVHQAGNAVTSRAELIRQNDALHTGDGGGIEQVCIVFPSDSEFRSTLLDKQGQI